MTDNEIINDFEKEIKYVRENEKYDDFNPIVDIDLCEDILDLIHRKNAEIERLKKSLEEAVSCFNRMESIYKIKCKELEIAKSEAIKEFAEEIEYFILNEDVEIVKPKCKYYGSYINGANQFRHQIKNGIKKLVKEMTEVNDFKE